MSEGRLNHGRKTKTIRRWYLRHQSVDIGATPSRSREKRTSSCAGSFMRPDTKVSPILSSDRSEVAGLVSWTSNERGVLAAYDADGSHRIAWDSRRARVTAPYLWQGDLKRTRTENMGWVPTLDESQLQEDTINLVSPQGVSIIPIKRQGTSTPYETDARTWCAPSLVAGLTATRFSARVTSGRSTSSRVSSSTGERAPSPHTSASLKMERYSSRWRKHP